MTHSYTTSGDLTVLSQLNDLRDTRFDLNLLSRHLMRRISVTIYANDAKNLHSPTS